MIPHDLTQEFRAAMRARQSRQLWRFAAALGLGLFGILVGAALGSLIASGASYWLVGAVVFWGVWSIRYLLLRH